MRAVSIFVFALILLVGCTGMGKIGQDDVAGTPTKYALVEKAPNPLLLGSWRRIPPSEFKRANQYEYFMVQKGDKYAVFYYYRDDHTGDYYKGWVDATINGNTLQIGFDGTTITVKGNELYHKSPAHGGEQKMMKLN